LQCHLCKTKFPAEALYVCDQCLGPLEPFYDYSAIRLTREQIEKRPKNLWRYRELLPIADRPLTGFNSGFTPLVRCDRLADRLGVSELYIKDDSVNHPTLSYKDRVVSVAATRAVELGFKVLACASTGNLANSVAAHAARLGVECCVFIPDNLEAGKLLGSAIFNPTILAIAGTYDDVNRLCTQVADRYGWGFVNINLRSYYAEGAKTFGFEIVEQLGWRYPQHLVSAGRGRHAAAAESSADSASCARSASSTAIYRASTPPRLPAARRSSARSIRGSSIRSRFGPIPSPNRSRSAIPRTVIRSSRR
jgi:threonine synthase